MAIMSQVAISKGGTQRTLLSNRAVGVKLIALEKIADKR